MQLDILPSLTDENRATLSDGYVAIQGCSPALPQADFPTFERWRNQVLLDVAARA